MRCLQRRPIRAQKEGGNREKAWSMLQGNTKKGKKTKALAARAFDRKSGTPGWIRTSGLPLRSSPQFANRFVTKHKETQAFTGFWRVLFLTIPKGFTAKITSFFGL